MFKDKVFQIALAKRPVSSNATPTRAETIADIEGIVGRLMLQGMIGIAGYVVLDTARKTIVQAAVNRGLS